MKDIFLLFIKLYIFINIFLILSDEILLKDYVPPCNLDTVALKLKKDSLELSMHLERYHAAYGHYPSEKQGLRALIEIPKFDKIPENYKPMIKNRSAILDPWGTPYILKFKTNSDDFMIVTLGKNKIPGGKGKNMDFNILKGIPKAYYTLERSKQFFNIVFFPFLLLSKIQDD
ncbi:MAG: type II secretion system protein GspG [Leptospiraceae bacterium]|nr:type II secretion system protein GspG [Leptospiraceae bacterium]